MLSVPGALLLLVLVLLVVTSSFLGSSAALQNQSSAAPKAQQQGQAPAQLSGPGAAAVWSAAKEGEVTSAAN
jgi:hypothetical protein